MDGEGADDQGDQEHRDGGDEEELEGVLEKLHHGGGVVGHKEEAGGDVGGDQLPGVLIPHQGGEDLAGDVAPGVEDAIKGGHTAVGPPAEQLVGSPGGDGDLPRGEQFLVPVCAGGADHQPLGVAHQDGGVGEEDHRLDVVDKVLVGEGTALGEGHAGVVRDEAGVAVQGGLDLLELVAVGQGEEPCAQQGHTEDDEAQHHRDLAQVHAFRLCHSRVPGQSLWSSNLYPTPQTVFRDHWSLTPSSFSRRRLMCTSTVRESPK